MIQENEIITFIIFTGIFIIMLVPRNWHYFKKSGIYLYIFYAFLSFYTAIFFTIAEGFILPDLFNHLEHFCYMLSSVFMMLFFWKSIFKKG